MMEVARWKWHKNAQEWGKSSTKGQEDAWKMLHRGEKKKRKICESQWAKRAHTGGKASCGSYSAC